MFHFEERPTNIFNFDPRPRSNKWSLNLTHDVHTFFSGKQETRKNLKTTRKTLRGAWWVIKFATLVHVFLVFNYNFNED